MGRNTVYRLFDEWLPGPLCDLIVAEARSRPAQVAALQPDQGAPIVDKDIRRTRVVYWDAGHWLSGITTQLAQLANAECWHYELTCSQGVQFGIYGVGGTYDWHKDEFDQPFGDEAPPVWQGQARKLSVSINLTDPREYAGGELRLRDTYGHEITDAEFKLAAKRKGSAVVFPAYAVHRVTPVTRGERCSLVSWILGPPFR